MSNYPKRVNDWRGMAWACCESSIGPACNHMRLPDGPEWTDEQMSAYARAAMGEPRCYGHWGPGMIREWDECPACNPEDEQGDE